VWAPNHQRRFSLWDCDDDHMGVQLNSGDGACHPLHLSCGHGEQEGEQHEAYTGTMKAL